MTGIEEIREDQGVRSRELAPGAGRPAARARQVAMLDELVADLTARLPRLPTGESETAFASVLEALALGLSAERAWLMLPGDPGDVFEVAQRWDRAATGPRALDPAGLDLRAASPLAESLRDGRPHRVRSWRTAAPPALAAPDLETGDDPAPGGAALHLPCLGSQGLLGVLVVEIAGSRLAGITPALERRAGQVAELLAGFLDRRRLEKSLATLRRERAQDQRLAGLGRLAGSVCHDFNNLLTAILGYGDLLELELGEAAAAHPELREIREAATRASHLVDQVLRLGRPRSGAPKEIEVGPTLRRFEGLLRCALGGKNVLALDLPDDLPAIRFDSGALERVVLNLVANARDAIEATGRDRGRFRLEARVACLEAEPEPAPGEVGRGRLGPGRYLRLTARDDGCGVDPSVRDRLFDAFVTTKAPGRGTGLGLAGVADLLEEGGGAIRLEAASGPGSVFHLFFPIG